MSESHLDNIGYELRHDGKVIESLRWAEVERIYSYRVDLYVSDELWLVFDLGPGRQVEIGEGDPNMMNIIFAFERYAGLEEGTLYLTALETQTFDPTEHILWSRPAT